MAFSEMGRLFMALALLSGLFACKEKQLQPVVKNPETVLDTPLMSKIREFSTAYSTIEVRVAQVDSTYSLDFTDFILIAQQLSYSVSGAIEQPDSMDFHCWRPISQGQVIERLVYRGVRTYAVYLKEQTKNPMKKGMFLEEAIFPSQQEAQHAEKKIRKFIYQDSSTSAYDKRPTDIFRYENRIYQLSVGAFNSIPDMKTVCRKFRKKLGPSATRIMLWDYYGYGE